MLIFINIMSFIVINIILMLQFTCRADKVNGFL